METPTVPVKSTPGVPLKKNKKQSKEQHSYMKNSLNMGEKNIDCSSNGFDNPQTDTIKCSALNIGVRLYFSCSPMQTEIINDATFRGCEATKPKIRHETRYKSRKVEDYIVYGKWSKQQTKQFIWLGFLIVYFLLRFLWILYEAFNFFSHISRGPKIRN